MAELDALLSDLANLDAQHDLDGLRRVREQIVAEHPDSEPAVEALYKIGLDYLFRERHLERAVAKFEEAAKRKAPFWSDAARTSLGLCYFHQHRAQKALLELRKVGYPDKPNPHSVTALAFIETIYEAEGKTEEVSRVRKDRVSQLEQLVKASAGQGGAAERGYFLFQLGLACRDVGDDKRANEALKDAKALGPDVLGADLFRAVIAALR
jgi:tetratricopeptide (TPR) repeat protein